MQLELADIQAIIVTGYGHLQWSSYLFLHSNNRDRSKQWLGSIIPEITIANWGHSKDGKVRKPDSAVNVAFTAPGLAALGLGDDVLMSFAEEFREGMGEKSRAQRLGDNGHSAPEYWEIGPPGSADSPEVHILLMFEAASQDELKALVGKYRSHSQSFGLTEANEAQEGHTLPGQKEHFGFHDSISQPEIEGSPKPVQTQTQRIKAGEFILGYKNEYGLLPPTPFVEAPIDVHADLPALAHSGGDAQSPPMKDLGKNGSYLVFRKLQQDVAGFRKYLAENGKADAAQMAAKFVGRWPSGLPLLVSPDRDDPALALRIDLNDFDYAGQDPYGYKCPIGAHIRRANPRDTMENRQPPDSLVDVRRHRILRRGVPYGDPLPEGKADGGAERGILFIGVNASIKRQFEFIQQTWCNNEKFNGLYHDRDPIIGDNEEPGDPLDSVPRNFTIQSRSVRTRLKHVPRFVTVRGGGYFFLPGVKALYFLSGIKAPSAG